VTSAAAFDQNVRLLKERLEVELADAEAFVEAEAGRQFTGVLGRMFAGVARTLLHWIGRDEIRRKTRAQVDLVTSISRQGGPADGDALFQANRDRILALDEVYQRANKHHAAWPRVQPHMEDLIRKRFLALHRYLHGPSGPTFEAAARAAYPERADLATVLEEQMQISWEITRLIEKDPGVLRVPGILEKPLFRLVNATLKWYDRRIGEFLRDVYETGPHEGTR